MDKKTVFECSVIDLGKVSFPEGNLTVIENDSQLGFKIENFSMVPSSSTTDLQATFTCKDITIKGISNSSSTINQSTNNQTNNTTTNTNNTTSSNSTNTANSTNNSTNTNTANNTNTTNTLR